ncbi:hypothetical protein [Bradyrhizobium sp. RDI18]|uniref:hypothetical protein n=1 Tax=Bradyrhizobium sp. RDI18 TaxID=3367400 RepID=UPI00371BE737
MTLVAPGVRFNAFEILATPDFDFAIVFIVRTSSFVHARRTTFLAFAILTPIHVGQCRASIMTVCVGEQEQTSIARSECDLAT